MDYRATVRFNAEEHRILDETVRLWPIAFPMPGDVAEKDPDFTFPAGHPYRSALVALGRWGEFHSRKAIDLGLLALEQLADRLEQESDRAYWDAIAPQRTVPATSEGVSLIAPGFEVAAVLTEIRRDQYEVASQALSLLGQALSAWPVGNGERVPA